jgi:hypothetical protein
VGLHHGVAETSMLNTESGVTARRLRTGGGRADTRIFT